MGQNMVTFQAESRLGRLLNAGTFVVTGELTPPRDTDSTVFERRVREISGVVDAANLTDNPGASVHASALAGAVLALRAGVEPILQVTCRDRNRIGLMSDLLGAWMLGMRNVMAMTGDSPAQGNQPEAKPVFDFDSLALIKAISTLREDGKLPNDIPVAHPPRFLIGGAEAPSAAPVVPAVERLHRKVTAGVNFVQTQFIYELGPFEEWLGEIERQGFGDQLSVIAGVGVIRSADTARHMRDNLPGSGVPAWVPEQLEGLSGKAAEEKATRIATDIIAKLRGLKGVAGVHIMPVGWAAGLPTVVNAAGLTPRPVV